MKATARVRRSRSRPEHGKGGLMNSLSGGFRRRRLMAFFALVVAAGGGTLAADQSAAADAGSGAGRVLAFDVVFTPFNLVNVGDPAVGQGDFTVSHDRLFSRGREVGDGGGTCTIVAPPT